MPPSARTRTTMSSLLTPVLKAFLTEQGFAVASDALQVFGGHGYVHDWGVEQCLRDSRIAMIYEGTNEIQAIDLLLRKVLPDGGAKFAALLDSLRGCAARRAPAMPTPRGPRSARCARRSGRLVDAAAGDAELPHRVAADFLRATGLVLLAQAWARADAVRASRAWTATLASTAPSATAPSHCFDDVLPEFDFTRWRCSRRARRCRSSTCRWPDVMASAACNGADRVGRQRSGSVAADAPGRLCGEPGVDRAEEGLRAPPRRRWS